jgi:hypothetical protein
MRIWQTLEEHKRKGCLKRKINELKTNNISKKTCVEAYMKLRRVSRLRANFVKDEKGDESVQTLTYSLNVLSLNLSGCTGFQIFRIKCLA